MTIELEPADGGRFILITPREAPEAEMPLPLAFDAAAVVAIEARGDGRYVLHLLGGQTIQLKGSVAGAVLKKLGLPVPKAKPKRPKAEPRAKQPPEPPPAALLPAALKRFFSL